MKLSSSSVWTRKKVRFRILPLPSIFPPPPARLFRPIAHAPSTFSIFLSLRTGYIDLSKRRVSPEDITKCEERYMKSKTVASILRHVATKLPSYDPTAADPSDPSAKSGETKSKRGPKGGAPPRANGAGAEGAETAEGAEVAEGAEAGSSEEERLEKLYEQIAWPLNKKYAHPYDAFKVALTCVPLDLILHHLAHDFLPILESRGYIHQRSRHRLLQPTCSAPTRDLPTPHTDHRPPSDPSAYQTPS